MKLQVHVIQPGARPSSTKMSKADIVIDLRLFEPEVSQRLGRTEVTVTTDRPRRP